MARVNTPGLIEACADGEATQAGTKTRISDRLFSLRHRGLRRSGGPTWLPSPIRIMICFAAFQVAQDADADASLAPRSGEMAKRTTRSLLL